MKSVEFLNQGDMGKQIRQYFFGIGHNGTGLKREKIALKTWKVAQSNALASSLETRFKNTDVVNHPSESLHLAVGPITT